MKYRRTVTSLVPSSHLPAEVVPPEQEQAYIGQVTDATVAIKCEALPHSRKEASTDFVEEVENVDDQEKGSKQGAGIEQNLPLRIPTPSSDRGRGSASLDEGKTVTYKRRRTANKEESNSPAPASCSPPVNESTCDIDLRTPDRAASSSRSQPSTVQSDGQQTTSWAESCAAAEGPLAEAEKGAVVAETAPVRAMRWNKGIPATRWDQEGVLARYSFGAGVRSRPPSKAAERSKDRGAGPKRSRKQGDKAAVAAAAEPPGQERVAWVGAVCYQHPMEEALRLYNTLDDLDSACVHEITPANVSSLSVESTWARKAAPVTGLVQLHCVDWGGRPWPVTLHLAASSASPASSATFKSGWPQFLKGAHLGVGDVLVLQVQGERRVIVHPFLKLGSHTKPHLGEEEEAEEPESSLSGAET